LPDHGWDLEGAEKGEERIVERKGSGRGQRRWDGGDVVANS